MRWYHKPEDPYSMYRIRRWFAFYPVTIGLETRWLEWVRVEQMYGCDWFGGWWENIRFLNR